jgi:hypothetical protein
VRSLLRRLVRVEQRVGDGGAVDDIAGQVAEPLLAGTGVCAEQGECLCEVDLAAFGEYAFGLFDDDAAVEGGLQLLGEHLLSAEGAFLQDADGGYVGADPSRHTGLHERRHRADRRPGKRDIRIVAYDLVWPA